MLVVEDGRAADKQERAPVKYGVGKEKAAHLVQGLVFEGGGGCQWRRRGNVCCLHVARAGVIDACAYEVRYWQSGCE